MTNLADATIAPEQAMRPEDHQRMRGVIQALIVTAVVFLPSFVVTQFVQDPPLWLNAIGPVSVILAVVAAHFMLKRDGRSFKHLGMGRPKRIWLTVLLAFAGTLGVLIIAGPITAGVQQLTDKQPDLSAFEFMRGWLPGLFIMLGIAWTTAAFGEEMVFRGFVLNRLAESMGAKRRAFVVAALVQSVIFGLAHSYQGPIGAFGAGLVGLLIAVLYLIVKRNLWVAILTHGLYDTIGLTFVYVSLNTPASSGAESAAALIL